MIKLFGDCSRYASRSDCTSPWETYVHNTFDGNAWRLGLSSAARGGPIIRSAIEVSIEAGRRVGERSPIESSDIFPSAGKEAGKQRGIKLLQAAATRVADINGY